MTIDLLSVLIGMVLMYLLSCTWVYWNHTWIPRLKRKIEECKDEKQDTNEKTMHEDHVPYSGCRLGFYTPDKNKKEI